MSPFDNPRHELVRRWAGWLDALTTAALALAAAAAVTPGQAGEVLGVALVAGLVAVPLLRVALAALRFWRIGDRRYSVVALALVAVVIAGSAAALLGR